MGSTPKDSIPVDPECGPGLFVFFVVVVWREMVFLNIPGTSGTYKSKGFRDSIDWFGDFQKV